MHACMSVHACVYVCVQVCLCQFMLLLLSVITYILTGYTHQLSFLINHKQSPKMKKQQQPAGEELKEQTTDQ